jgi:hypothetical protein
MHYLHYMTVQLLIQALTSKMYSSSQCWLTSLLPFIEGLAVLRFPAPKFDRELAGLERNGALVAQLLSEIDDGTSIFLWCFSTSKIPNPQKKKNRNNYFHSASLGTIRFNCSPASIYPSFNCALGIPHPLQQSHACSHTHDVRKTLSILCQLIYILVTGTWFTSPVG